MNNTIRFAATAALFAACAAQAQEVDDSVLLAPSGPAPAAAAQVAQQPAPSVLLPRPTRALSSTPALSAPFKHVEPVPRAYLRNLAEPDTMPRDPAAFGRWVTDPRLLAGVNLTPWFVLETGYVNLVDRGTYFADYARPWETSGGLGTKGFHTHAAAKLMVPVGQRFEAYGKVGIAYSEFNHRDEHGKSVTEVDAGPYVGMGARYKLSEKASVTAGYERYGDTEKKWGNNTNNTGLKAKLNLGF